MKLENTIWRCHNACCSAKSLAIEQLRCVHTPNVQTDMVSHIY